jgi:hypothetical protein
MVEAVHADVVRAEVEPLIPDVETSIEVGLEPEARSHPRTVALEVEDTVSPASLSLFAVTDCLDDPD